MRTLTYKVFKGISGKWGSVQFTPMYPCYKNGPMRDRTGEAAFGEDNKLKEGWSERPGNVLLEITSSKGKNIYDWDNKISIALTVDEIGKFILFTMTGEPVSIVHDPNAQTKDKGKKTKELYIYTGKEGTLKGCMFKATEKEGSEKVKEHSVPLSGSELIVLKSLLQSVLPSLLSWE